MPLDKDPTPVDPPRLFQVRCQTCGRMLNIHTESVIGTIQLCPGCESMVHIEDPDAKPTPTPEGEPVAEIDPRVLTPEEMLEELTAGKEVEPISPEILESPPNIMFTRKCSQGHESGCWIAPPEPNEDPGPCWTCEQPTTWEQLGEVMA